MKEVNLLGLGLKSYSFAVAPEYRVNTYYELRTDDEGQHLIIRATPGSFVKYTLPGGVIRGLHAVGSNLYVVADANVFKITSAGVITRVATLATSSGVVRMADNYLQLIFVDGTGGYFLTLATNVLTTIVDANFPNGCTTVAYISSRFVVEKPSTREFYCSAVLDAATWTALSLPIFATKEQNPDLLVAVYNYNGVLVLLGAGSIEYWQDAGLSPLPFQRITGTTQAYGLTAKDSVTTVGNTMLFLGSSSLGGYGVFAVNGYEPKRISTPDVDNILSTLAVSYTLSDAIALTYSVDAHDMYQLTFPTANVSLLYDLTSQMWSIVRTGISPARHYANYGTKFNNLTIFSDTTTPNLYQFSSLAYADNNTQMLRQFITKHVRNNGNEFAVSELKLWFDTGNVPQSSDYHVSMEVSRDGGRTYGSPRSRTVGRVGQYSSPQCKWDRMGSAKDFVFRFSVTDPFAFAVSRVSIETSGT